MNRQNIKDPAETHGLEEEWEQVGVGGAKTEGTKGTRDTQEKRPYE